MIGQKINNYEIRALLGQGGMGSVYLAQHPVLERRIAVKVLRREFADNSELVSRFVNEARAASAINHPAIVEVFDVGTLPDGLPYLIMELLEGETLAQCLERQRRLPVLEAVDVICQAASALAAAHEHGIVHRDLKPENLFLVADRSGSGRSKLKILDFGIAKLHRNLGAQAVRTHTGSVMGTPQYMSPEQCRGISNEIDHRTDIYALGVILHEMVAGAPPFTSEGYGDLLIMHLTKPPRPLRAIDASVPPAIEGAVLRALEKQRERRFDTVDQLARVLTDAATRPTLRDGKELGGPTRETTVPRRPVVGTPSGGLQTTLSATTGQMDAVAAAAYADRPPAPRPPDRRRVVFGVMVGVALGVSGAIVLAMRGAGPTPSSPSAGIAAPPPLATPAAAIDQPPPSSAPLPPAPAPAVEDPIKAPETAAAKAPPPPLPAPAELAEDATRAAGGSSSKATRERRRTAGKRPVRPAGAKAGAGATPAATNSPPPVEPAPSAAPATPALTPAAPAAPAAKPRANTEKW